MTNQAETHVNTRQTYQTERSVQIDHHADHTHPESGARVGNLAHCAFSSAISGNARIFGGNPLIWNYQCSTLRSMPYGSASSGRLRGRTNASGYSSVSSTSSSATTV